MPSLSNESLTNSPLQCDFDHETLKSLPNRFGNGKKERTNEKYKIQLRILNGRQHFYTSREETRFMAVVSE